MKKLFWIVLLVPFVAFADPATETGQQGVKHELEDQTAILTDILTAVQGAGGNQDIVDAIDAQTTILSDILTAVQAPISSGTKGDVWLWQARPADSTCTDVLINLNTGRRIFPDGTTLETQVVLGTSNQDARIFPAQLDPQITLQELFVALNGLSDSTPPVNGAGQIDCQQWNRIALGM